MKDTMGIILTKEHDTGLLELTQSTAVSALPIGGRYRLIDFVLSSLGNSGIVNVGITADSGSLSLTEHLGSGEPWNLRRNRYGLKILAGADRENSNIVESLMGIMPFLRQSRQKYAILANGNTIFNMTFMNALKFHKEMRSDITVIYRKTAEKDVLSSSDVLEIDENGRLYGFERKPRKPQTQNVSMNIYIMERQLLMKMTERAAARRETDFITECMAKENGNMRIFCFRHFGYAGKIDSVFGYYKHNMDMLKTEVRRELFRGENKIYTRSQNKMPALYGENADVYECLVSDGCTIKGNIENCVVSRGVRISEGVTLKNSVVMEKTYIGRGSELDCVVLDKECVIREGIRLFGQQSYPILIGRGTVI